MNFKFKPGKNSNTNNFVVSNCDLPAKAVFEISTNEMCKVVEPNEAKQTRNEVLKCLTMQIKCSTGHAKCPERRTALGLGLLNTKNFTIQREYVYKALPVSWDDKEII